MITTPAGSTSRSARSVGDAARSGGRWGAISGVSEQIVSLIVTVVLARLLAPEDFGLVAATMLVVTLLSSASDVGLGPALVKRESVDDRSVSSTFWLATALGAVGALICLVVAEQADALLGIGEAAGLVRAAGALVALGLMAGVVRALLQRRLAFRAIFGINIASSILYGAVAIALAALTGAGAWAIIIGRIAMGVFRLVALATAARWRPSAIFDRRSAFADLRFSMAFLGGRLTNDVSKNVDYWVIGQRFGERSLGGYYIAFVLPSILRQRLTWLVSSVGFPVLSRLERPFRDRAFLRLQGVIVFIALPALLGLAAIADPLIAMLFGSQWDGVGEITRILAVAAVFDVITATNTPMLLSLGHADRVLRINLSRLAVLGGGIGLAVTTDRGVTGIAAAVLVAAAASMLVSLATIRTALDVTIVAQVWSFARTAAVSLTMALTVHAADQQLSLATPLQVAVLLVAGAAIYAIGARLFNRSAFELTRCELMRLLRPGAQQPPISVEAWS